MEGWCREADRDRDVLMRIVALLVSLATLADRTAGLSGRRRRHVLDILCESETVAHAFVAGLMPAPPVQWEEPVPVYDAARLAATFRLLALVLYTTLQRRTALSGDIAPLTVRSESIGRQFPHPAVPAADTS